MKFFTKSAWGVITAAALSVEFAAAEDLASTSQKSEEPQPTSRGEAAPPGEVEGPDASEGDTEGAAGEPSVDGAAAQGESGDAAAEITSGEAKGGEREKEKTLNACISHHEKAQLARLRGGYLEALRELSACVAKECPQVLRSDCLGWRNEVDALTPTVIVVAEDDAGDVEDARILVDGVVTRESLDGRPIPLDPGTHRVSVQLPNGGAKEQRLVVSEGERNRRVAFRFRATPRDVVPVGASPTKTIRPVPPGVYLLGGTAFLGLGVALGFGSDAYSKSRTARDRCAPLCSPEVTRAVNERAAVADVALGVAIASTIGAVVVYTYRPERVVAVERVSVDVQPQVGGGGVAMTGAFR